jgi:hypothetical protein
VCVFLLNNNLPGFQTPLFQPPIRKVRLQLARQHPTLLQSRLSLLEFSDARPTLGQHLSKQ